MSHLRKAFLCCESRFTISRVSCSTAGPAAPSAAARGGFVLVVVVLGRGLGGRSLSRGRGLGRLVPGPPPVAEEPAAAEKAKGNQGNHRHQDLLLQGNASLELMWIVRIDIIHPIGRRAEATAA